MSFLITSHFLNSPSCFFGIIFMYLLLFFNRGTAALLIKKKTNKKKISAQDSVHLQACFNLREVPSAQRGKLRGKAKRGRKPQSRFICLPTIKWI